MDEDLLLNILFISFRRVFPLISYTMTSARFFPQKLLWKNPLALYIFVINELNINKNHKKKSLSHYKKRTRTHAIISRRHSFQGHPLTGCCRFDGVWCTNVVQHAILPITITFFVSF